MNNMKRVVVFCLVTFITLILLTYTAVHFGISRAYGADSVYVLSGDALITVNEQKVTVPAFAAELKVESYFKCGEYDGKSIYNVPCVGATCDKLRKSAYFVGNNTLEIALENPEIAKALSDVTVEVDAVDPETKESVKVQKRLKYKDWVDKGRPGIMKRIDKPVIWQ